MYCLSLTFSQNLKRSSTASAHVSTYFTRMLKAIHIFENNYYCQHL